jgi:hypothetical protein
MFLERENRDHHPDENRADKRRDEKEHERFGQSDRALELTVDV